MSVISGSWLRARTIAVILGAALAATGVPADAEAQAATTTYQLEIPSQSLHDALQALALASRHRMFYQADIVNGKVNAAISGKYTTEEAVRAMLAGTNLEYEISADGVVIVRARGSASSKTSWTGGTGSLHLAQAATSSESDKTYLDEVVVKGTTIDDPILSSRTGDTVRDRPRAVTIVTRERLDEQNINTVNSVLDQSTGVTVARVNFANQRYYARGFQIGSLQVDGAAPIPTDGSGSGFLNIADLSMYEQVEVMRGPDALFSGNGASGGSLQLVRKRPTKDTQMSLALLAGSWSQYRAEIDASGPLGWDGRLRGRVVYAKEDSDSYLSNGESRRDQLYGIIEADLSDSTLLAVGGTYGNADNPQGSTGLPLYDDATDPHLPRSTIISPTWARQKRDAGTAFIQFEQRLGESWNLRANAMKVRVDTEGWGASSYNPINRQSGLISSTSNVSASEQAEDLTFLDLTLRGKFELFGYSQTVAVGVDAQDIRNKAKIWSFANFTNLNPFTYDPDAVPQPARGVIPSTLYSWPIKQDGAYLNLVLQVADPLKVMGGVRYSNYKYDFDLQGLNTTTGAVSFGFRTKYEESGVLTPYVGLTYELNSNWLLYGSIADQYQSQASSLQGPLPGTPVDPITGRNVEFGIKGGLWDGRAATQLAIYQIDRRNEAVRDLTYAQQAGQFGSLCCYLTRGTVQSRGADFEINGKLLANWDLFVGYTFNVNKYESGYANGLGQKYNPQTPKHLLKLWTTYGLPHNEQWKFSLGVVAQSENYVDGSSVVYAGSNPVGTSSFRFTAGAYAIVGARVAYDINPTWSVALNADNIFDKVYYKTIGVTGYGTWYGDPRSFTLSLRSRW